MEPHLNDIEEGIRLASNIHATGFTAESTADVRYKNFQNDVFTLRQHLDKLRESLRNAQRRYIDRGRTLTVRAYEPLSEDFERERKSFIGDVSATFEACDALLKDNIKIRFRYNNDAEELSWHLVRQEQRVVGLRNRLHVHSEKVRLAVDRISQDLLTDRYTNEGSLLDIARYNADTSHEILPDLRRQISGQYNVHESLPLHVHAVSSAISRRFDENILIDAPPGIESGLPLGVTFDALVDSFLGSHKGSDQTPERYLLFLKSRWLLERLKQSTDFHDASPAVYYRPAIVQIESAILNRIRKPGELLAYDEDTLMHLPASTFRIWPSITAVPTARYIPSNPLVARANEEKLVCIALASGNPAAVDVATVFKVSDQHFRIVVKSTLDPSIGSTSLLPQTVHCSEDRLIPRYALPTVANPSPEMAIFSRNEETLYSFNTFSDLYQFQTALTGYDVSHDQANIRCQFSDDLFFLDCVGRLQLWQNPITAPLVAENDNLHRSVRTANSLNESLYSRRDSILSSVAPSNTVTWTASGWEADDIKLPTLKIFTQLADKSQKNRFAIISITLEPGTYIDPSECGCARDYLTCSKLVLTRDKKKGLPVKTFYSEVDGSNQPNPNTFDIFPFRLRRHPHSSPSKHTEYLVLKFRSLPEKQSFHRELDLRFRVRDKQIEDQRNFTNTMRHRQDRPQGRPKVTPPGQSHLPAPSVLSFQTSLPPVLDEPETGPTLVDSLASGRTEYRSEHRVSETRRRPIVSTPRSASSSRTAQSFCTSLDSMVLANRDVERIDRYLAEDAKRVLTPDTASSIHSAAARSNTFEAQNRASNNPVQAPRNVQDHKEFYGPPREPEICGLVRSPSAVAPEYYNPNILNEKAYEATGYNGTVPYFDHRISHQAPTPVAMKAYEVLPHDPTSQLPRSQFGMAPQWYNSESITAYYNHGQPDQSQHSQRLAPIPDERSGFQNESSVSRSKTTKRKGNWNSLKFWQR